MNQPHPVLTDSTAHCLGRENLSQLLPDHMKRALGEVCIQVPLEHKGKSAYVWESQEGFVEEVLCESLGEQVGV